MPITEQMAQIEPTSACRLQLMFGAEAVSAFSGAPHKADYCRSGNQKAMPWTVQDEVY